MSQNSALRGHQHPYGGLCPNFETSSWRLRHIARAIFGSDYREAYIAVFTAYFDVSGKKTNRVMAASGFVAKQTRWEKLEEQWKELLPSTVNSFHMTDFVSSRRGWEDWRGKSQKRAILLDSLIECASKFTRKGFAMSISLREYNAVDKEYALSEHVNSPYGLVMMGCLYQLGKWTAKHEIDPEKLLCVIEEGDEGQGPLIAAARREGFNAIPQSKKNIRAFDVCDLAAWKSKTLLDDSNFRPGHRDDHKALANKTLTQLSTIVQLNQCIDRNALLDLCHKNKVPKRTLVLTG